MRWRPLVLAVVLALSLAALRTAWTGWQAYLPLLAAAAAGLVVAALLRRLPLSGVLALAVLALVPAAAMVVVGRGQQLGPLGALTDPFPRLLTSATPAPATPGLLLPGLLIAWLAGAVGGWLLCGRHFAGAPLLVSLLVMIPAELLNAGASDRDGLLTAALVVVILAQWSGGRRHPARALVAAAIAAATLGCAPFSLGHPFQPRHLITPPSIASEEPNPLPALSLWANSPRLEILRRSGDPEAQLRLVTLPDYDGVSFFSASRYSPLGGPARSVLAPGPHRRTATVSVSWQSRSRWLPGPGAPAEISVPGVRVDPDSGSMLLPARPDGVIDYTVTGAWDAASVEEALGAAAPVAQRYLELPRAPEAFGAYARQVTRGDTTAYARAKSLERALRRDRDFSARMPGGTSYARLHTFLFTPADQGGMAGTSEQFAAAFAVLGRTVGLPTRVVVGFGRGTEEPAGSGTRVVRGEDALAWPEVYFTGLGWVPFAPTPRSDNAAPEIPETVAERDAEDPAVAQSAAPADRPPDTATSPESPAAASHRSGGVAAALLAIIPGLALARLARRVRHRHAGPIGAWDEIVDAMRLTGRPGTAREGALAQARRCGSPDALRVAYAAEAASFGARRAGAAMIVPIAATEEVWHPALRVTRLLRRQASPWRRAVWFVSPSPWLPRLVGVRRRVSDRCRSLRRRIGPATAAIRLPRRRSWSARGRG